tara:strand:+ start:299 stop:424 length:126 start_codon:yes stop_codon:yes gene_type:complete
MRKKIVKIITIVLIGILSLLYVRDNFKKKRTQLREESKVGI